MTPPTDPETGVPPCPRHAPESSAPSRPSWWPPAWPPAPPHRPYRRHRPHPRRRGQPTLADLAERHGRYFGSATDNPELTDTAYTKILGSEFDMITPGNGMKWYATEPQQGVFDWTSGDEIVNLARKNHQKVRAHTLVWHSQLPDWLTSRQWTASELRAVLKKHITAEVRHYRGKVYSWDVVNEAFEEDGSYRETIWYKTLGPGYIADALRWAHQADPHAKLYLNDYNIEATGPKSDAYYRLAKELKAQGCPSTASASRPIWPCSTAIPPPWRTTSAASPASASTPRSPRSTCGCSCPRPRRSWPSRRPGTGTSPRPAWPCAAASGVTIWDYTDKYSWIPAVFPGEGAALPWDEDLRPKPAYQALREALR